MIHLSFNIRNPFSDRWECLANPVWQISRHKAIELQFDRCTDIVGFAFRATVRQDHAGMFVAVSLLGFEGMLTFYDTRHWNKETNAWEQYD